jgi:hypothetical protein
MRSNKRYRILLLKNICANADRFFDKAVFCLLAVFRKTDLYRCYMTSNGISEHGKDATL